MSKRRSSSTHLTRSSKAAFLVVVMTVMAVWVTAGNPTSASALAAGTAPFAAATVTPSTGGGSLASINIATPSGAVCYGDTASGGVRWSTFLVSKSIDPATLTYGAAGPIAPAGAPAGAVVTPLVDTNGSAIASRTTGVTSGLITPLSLSTFNFFPAGFLPAGQYWVGFACYGGIAGNATTGAFVGNQTGRYFSTILTITPNATATGGTPQITFASPIGYSSLGVVSMSPASAGGAEPAVSITPPLGASCPGDTASGGFRWSTFLVPRSIEPAALTYNPGGPVAPAGALPEAAVWPLFDSAGTNISYRTTEIGTGLINRIPLTSFNVFPAEFLPVGEYWAGFACHAGFRQPSVRYWSTALTITPNATATGGTPQISFAQGFAPDAPVLGPLTSDIAQLSGTFTTAATAAAPIASLSVTATPQGGGAPVVQSLLTSATSFTITGLTSGTAYDVKVTATNTIGSTDSNVQSTVVGRIDGTIGLSPTLSLSGITGGIRAGIIAPANEPAGATRTGYTLVVTTDAALTVPAAGSPFTLPANATSFDVTGLAANTVFYAQVTATYVAPYFGAPSPVAISPFCLCGSLIQQPITVARPPGALVLTQRCGVFGALPAEPASAAFPVDLPAASEITGIGSAPQLVDENRLPIGPDPLFADYPYPQPANYVTRCGVTLGTASLVTSGPSAGNYFTAHGRLNQVTVVNTQDLDNGWNLIGTMGDFTLAGSSNTFSGDFLGWKPQVSGVSNAVTGATVYAMVVAPGATVDPNTAGGLSTGRMLASSSPGQSLGIATLDARISLLIPANARSGTYTGILTLSLI